MTILGADISHFQGSPNFAQVRSSGREFVVLKATEGTTYVDPTFAANRRNAHAAGLVVGLYHFARAGNAAAEAAWFVKTIGALQPGEFLVLDWEVAYTGDHVAWCKTWLDAVTAATGVAPLIYMNQSAMNGHNWMPLSGRHGLWLAKYDGSPAAPTACNCWPAAAMKQYSSTAAVPGIAGSCDVNAFYGTRDQLLAYSTPEDDMPTADEVAAAVWNHLVTQVEGIGPASAAQFLQHCAVMSTRASTNLDGYGARIERIDEGSHGGWGYGIRIEDVQARVVALQAALAAVVAAGTSGLSKDDLKSAIAEALKENVVSVDVEVNGKPAPTT